MDCNSLNVIHQDTQTVSINRAFQSKRLRNAVEMSLLPQGGAEFMFWILYVLLCLAHKQL